MVDGDVWKTNAHELPSFGVSVDLNGEDAGGGTAAAVMGSPLNSVAWLASNLGRLPDDQLLKAGQVVITGTMHGKTAVVPGDLVTCDFGSLGVIAIEFTD